MEHELGRFSDYNLAVAPHVCIVNRLLAASYHTRIGLARKHLTRPQILIMSWIMDAVEHAITMATHLSMRIILQ